MNATSAHAPHVPTDSGGPPVSTVVVQRVPADRVQCFLECQRGLTQAAEGFPGYRGTELYPPADDRHQEWVAVIHFDDHESFERWLDSPVRAEWIKKLRDEIGDFQLKTLAIRFRRLVRRAGDGAGGEPPPSWKMAMTVLLGSLSHRHAARVARRATPESPGNGRVDADRQHTQRGHLPVGCDAAADERSGPLAPCECPRQEASFDRRACPDLAPPWGPRGPVPRGDGVTVRPATSDGLQRFSSLFRFECL